MDRDVLVKGLISVLGAESVLAGDAAERAYDCDAYTVEKSPPTAVAFPHDTEETARLVRWCIANVVPFTARGAGTGLSGGALPGLGGVVVSTKRMTKILEIDLENRVMKAQAGAVNKKLSDLVKDAGLHFAPDPSSGTVSTLGGNIAENAGGPHTLKYGVTAGHVLGVTLVTPEGEVVEIGGPVAGGPGFDLLGLIVGGEGTLGLVTEAWVKLTPLPTVIRTALAAFPTIAAATQTVADIIGSGTVPAALEMMDRGIMVAVRAAFGLVFPDDAEALLLVECDGDSEAAVEGEMDLVREVCHRHGAIEIRMAADAQERAALWTARKKSVGAMGRLAPTIVTHDGVIPRSKLPEMLAYVYEVAAANGLGIANMFHAGDGNLHPCFYFDDRIPGMIDKVVAAGEAIVHRCLELGGSVTGEHGIGTEKLDLMPLMFTPDDLAFQAQVKHIFNDGELCNPCKILPSARACAEHRTRWRGAAT